MQLVEGMRVTNESEHAGELGIVRSVEDGGRWAKMAWITAPSRALPYGAENLEKWPQEEWGELKQVATPRADAEEVQQ